MRATFEIEIKDEATFEVSGSYDHEADYKKEMDRLTLTVFISENKFSSRKVGSIVIPRAEFEQLVKKTRDTFKELDGTRATQRSSSKIRSFSGY